jgi:hypothetical protein
MPAFVLTYTSLVQNMKDYAQRGTVTDTRFNNNIPVMIMRAENKVGMMFKNLLSRQTINDALLITNPLLTKPALWRNTVSMMVATGVGFGTIKPVFLRTKEYIQTYWPTPATANIPKFYGDFDENTWIFGPTPAAAYPVQYVVDQAPTPLSDAVQTNAYTQKAPTVLQAAAFLEIEVFLQNAGKIAMRTEDLKMAATALEGEKAMQQTDRTQSAST